MESWRWALGRSTHRKPHARKPASVGASCTGSFVACGRATLRSSQARRNASVSSSNALTRSRSWSTSSSSALTRSRCRRLPFSAAARLCSRRITWRWSCGTSQSSWDVLLVKAVFLAEAPAPGGRCAAACPRGKTRRPAPLPSPDSDLLPPCTHRTTCSRPTCCAAPS